MKKFVRIMAFAMMLTLLCTAFVSCGKKLSGEYEMELADETAGGLEGILGNLGDALGDALDTSASLIFDGSKVTYKATVLGQSAEWEGTYSIDDDKITFDFVDEEEVTNDDLKDVLADINGTFDFVEDGDKIKIDGITYVKKD